MKIEHIAFNVKDPVAVAAWYVEHLGLQIIYHNPEASQMHFLSDGSGAVIEVYCNPADEVPNYKEQKPLILHLAFESSDPKADSERLVNAGAELIELSILNADTHFAMLRDPWGLAIQLCKRKQSFF